MSKSKTLALDPRRVIVLPAIMAFWLAVALTTAVTFA